MGPHNLITIHSSLEAFVFYGGGFAVGAIASVILCTLDRLNKGNR